MKLAIAQINPRIADFPRNTERILHAAAEAADAGATLLVTPELGICGYPPLDLLDQEAFVSANQRALAELLSRLPAGMAVLLGLVDRSSEGSGKALQNSVVLVRDGVVLHRQSKTLLPTYDVFDETRYFQPASHRSCVDLDGVRLGIAICEDIWYETEPVPGTTYAVDPVRDLLADEAQMLLVPSASPYHRGKLGIRHRIASGIARESGIPVVYCNTVGANDNLIFDGASFVAAPSGKIVCQLPRFREQVVRVPDPYGGTAATALEAAEEAEDLSVLSGALELGIRDYLDKTGFERVHLGLSGGIDSAVVAVLAVRALGADRVTGFLLPSTYSSRGSIDDAADLAARLGIATHTISIAAPVSAVEQSLSEWFSTEEPGLAEENIQARMRGLLLMAWSNKFGSLVLTTGNKSELAVGYCTLYGDMAGSLSVIGDVLKTEVYGLARFFNTERELVPQAIIEKPPSAELRPDQTDQDNLPPYDELDQILEYHLLDNLDAAGIAERGLDAETVQQVLGLVARSEYKRRQAPPVLKVSPRAFGTGRRIPVARAFYEREFAQPLHAGKKSSRA